VVLTTHKLIQEKKNGEADATGQRSIRILAAKKGKKKPKQLKGVRLNRSQATSILLHSRRGGKTDFLSKILHTLSSRHSV